MNTNKNYETMSSENLVKTAGGVIPTYDPQSVEQMRRQIEEAERKERERKRAERMVSTGIHSDPMFHRHEVY